MYYEFCTTNLFLFIYNVTLERLIYFINIFSIDSLNYKPNFYWLNWLKLFYNFTIRLNNISKYMDWN